MSALSTCSFETLVHLSSALPDQASVLTKNAHSIVTSKIYSPHSYELACFINDLSMLIAHNYLCGTHLLYIFHLVLSPLFIPGFGAVMMGVREIHVFNL